MQNKLGKPHSNHLRSVKTLIPFLRNFVNKVNFNKNQNQIDNNNEELMEYINKIFEQQERERIVRWLVNSIRESLELNTVLETIVEEIGKLLKVDRCLIALYEKEEHCLYFRSEYRKDSTIASLIKEEKTLCAIPYKWQYLLINSSSPILVHNSEKDRLTGDQQEYLTQNNIKSLIMIPLTHKEDFLGIIMVHQTSYQRNWEDSHFEILKDTGNQIAVAIGQAMLHSRIQKETKLKSEFLACMSHEFRTPLNAIIGFSQMLCNEDYGSLNEKQKKFVNNILLSGEHLLRLVNDILDLSKIESGSIIITPETFEVYPKIKETVSILKGLAIRKNIDISMDIDEELYIKADLKMFRQIMYNLLSNAIKFSDENGQIMVTAFRQGNIVKFEVQDNGIGIPKKDQDKIFKSFAQLDSSLTRRQEGTGLGLTLTKKFVEFHKGEIDFESEENRGSKFWFTLPQ